MSGASVLGMRHGRPTTRAARGLWGTTGSRSAISGDRALPFPMAAASWSSATPRWLAHCGASPFHRRDETRDAGSRAGAGVAVHAPCRRVVHDRRVPIDLPRGRALVGSIDPVDARRKRGFHGFQFRLERDAVAAPFGTDDNERLRPRLRGIEIQRQRPERHMLEEEK